LLLSLNTSVFKGNEKNLFVNLCTKLQKLIKTAILMFSPLKSVVRADIRAEKMYIFEYEHFLCSLSLRRKEFQEIIAEKLSIENKSSN